jgi:hypothetical protein
MLNKEPLRAAPTEPLIADIRVGCCAVYPESRIEDSPGLNQSQRRNVAYSTKGAKFVNGHWEMDETTAAYYRLFAAAPTILAEHDALCELVEAQHHLINLLGSFYPPDSFNEVRTKITTLRGRLQI